MAHYNYIDILYREYGEEFFGKSVMDKITEEQVEKARIETNKLISELARMYISQGKTNEFLNNPEFKVKKIFCDYISKNYI